MVTDLPEAAPVGITRLTPKQFDLLAWVYRKGYKGIGQRSPIVWSPKTYMGRSLSRSEAATLSKRVKTLVEHGLLTMHGRELNITDDGINRLRIYALEHPNKKGVSALLIRLDLDDILQVLGAYSKVIRAFKDYRNAMGLTEEEVDKAIEGISPLYSAALKRAKEKLERYEVVYDPEIEHPD
jgi:hypothetical protein